MYNPASYQPYRAVVSVPGLGGINFTAQNAGFNLMPLVDATHSGNEAIEHVLNNASSGDRLLIDESLDILYVGFRSGRSFWSFGVQQRLSVSFEYPLPLLNLAYYGSASSNVNGRVSMTGNSTDATAYLNYHLGYQRELMDGKLRVGGRFKYLSGLANASASRLNFSGQLNSSEWTFDTDIEAHMTNPLDSNMEMGEVDPMSLAFSDNRGFAFDLGASYEVIPGLEVSLAALDIGSITWSSNTTTYRSQGSYTWDGVNYNYGEPGDSSFNAEQVVEEIIEAMNFSETEGESYTTTLPRSFMVGVRYELTPKHGFAGTYQLNQWGERSYSNVGVSYIGNWSKWFSFYANYTYIEGAPNNVGVGFSANLGPVQLYLLTDNAMVAQFEDVRLANVRLGLNVALYRKDLKGYEPSVQEASPLTPPTPPEGNGENSSEGTTVEPPMTRTNTETKNHL